MKSKLILVLICFLTVQVHSQDWSQWRGPNRNGVISASEVPKEWPGKLERIWQIEVGEGHSSPIISDNKIFVFSRQNEEEVITCVTPTNG